MFMIRAVFCFVQIIPLLINLNQNRSKLKLYIGHLSALCHERDPQILQDLAPPSAYHRSQRDAWEEELRRMTTEEVMLVFCLVFFVVVWQMTG